MFPLGLLRVWHKQEQRGRRATAASCILFAHPDEAALPVCSLTPGSARVVSIAEPFRYIWYSPLLISSRRCGPHPSRGWRSATGRPRSTRGNNATSRRWKGCFNHVQHLRRRRALVAEMSLFCDLMMETTGRTPWKELAVHSTHWPLSAVEAVSSHLYSVWVWPPAELLVQSAKANSWR